MAHNREHSYIFLLCFASGFYFVPSFQFSFISYFNVFVLFYFYCFCFESPLRELDTCRNKWMDILQFVGQCRPGSLYYIQFFQKGFCRMFFLFLVHCWLWEHYCLSVSRVPTLTAGHLRIAVCVGLRACGANKADKASAGSGWPEGSVAQMFGLHLSSHWPLLQIKLSHSQHISLDEVSSVIVFSLLSSLHTYTHARTCTIHH